MGLSISDVIALTLKSNGGEIEGRTAMQKLIYFQTKKIPTVEITGYIHYFYGPFSRKVASRLYDMLVFHLIGEDRVPGHNNTYRYRLTEQGNIYASEVAKSHPKEHGLISGIVDVCKEHCGLRSEPLSYAAKSLYILENSNGTKGGKYSVKDIEQIARKFEWNVPQDDAKKGIKLLQTLGLVS